MAPLIVLLTLFIAFFTAGLHGVEVFAGWRTPLPFALAGMFLLTGWAHFGKPRADMVRMVPAVLGNAGMWVTLTGVLEHLGAVGLLVPLLAHYAAIGLTLLLIAMFPANIHAVRSNGIFNGRPAIAVFPRTVLQVIFVACTLAVALMT